MHTKCSFSQIGTFNSFKYNSNLYFKLSATILEYNIAIYIQFVFPELQEVERVVFHSHIWFQILWESHLKRFCKRMLKSKALSWPLKGMPMKALYPLSLWNQIAKQKLESVTVSSAVPRYCFTGAWAKSSPDILCSSLRRQTSHLQGCGHDQSEQSGPNSSLWPLLEAMAEPSRCGGPVSRADEARTPAAP